MRTLVLSALALGALTTAALAEEPAKPNSGWDLHIDAKLHTVGDPEAIVHHYCKTGLAGGIIGCQLYDSDEPDARLIGAEVVVDEAAYQSFSPEEQELWHHYAEEIPKTEATLPDLSSEEATEVVQSLEDTYGKIFLIWDTTANELPVGQPVAFADSTRLPASE
jgi:hypothetical protein